MRTQPDLWGTLGLHDGLAVARAPGAPGARLIFPAVDEMRSIDVAYYLGISKQRVSQLASEHGFPRSRHRADGTRV